MTFRSMHGNAKTRRPAVNACPGFRFALFAVVLGIATWAGCPQAQGQEARLSPVPQNPGAVPPSPVSGPLTPQPELPPGSVSPVLNPAPGLQVESDCFATAEATLVFPHLSSLLSAPVGLGTNGATTAVALRNARLDTTVSPLFQIGAFRFGPGFAELVFSYRILATDGTDLFPAFDRPGAGVFHSRLNLQTFGLDCVRNDCPLGPDTVLSWEAGARLQVVFFDTQAQTASSFQHARNYFFGAGPHVGLGLTTALTERVSLVSRVDTAFLVGYNTAQNFEVVSHDPVNGVLSGRFSQQQTEISPTFSVRTGLSWCPRWLPACRVGAGYQFEQWYNLGRVERSRGDLSAHGLFVSGEWQF